jgi:hypothetical protein
MVVAGPGGRVLESTSGIGWTIRDTGLVSAFDSVACSDERCVVVGNGSQVATSTDLIQWSQPTIAGVAVLPGVAYGDGVFLAVGDTTNLHWSTDGQNWTAITNSGIGGGPNFQDVAFGKDASGVSVFTVTNDTDMNVYYSDLTFASAWGSSTVVANTTLGVVYGDGRWVVKHDGPDETYTSTDLTNWSVAVPGSTGAIAYLRHFDGLFYAVYTDVTNEVFTSVDGASWTQLSNDCAGNNLRWQDILVTNGITVLVGVDNTGTIPTICSRADGETTWTTETFSGFTGTLRKITTFSAE